MKESVAELKGEKTKTRIVTDISIDIEAYAPDGYIPTQAERMTFYQQLASCKSVEEMSTVNEQLVDVYGVAPRQVDNLFTVARLKLLANNAGIARVTIKTGKGELTFATRDDMMNKKVFDALSDFGDRATAASDSYGVQFVSRDFIQKERLISAIEDFLLKIQP